MPRAALDFGSNSLKLVVQGDDGQVLWDEQRVVGLGTGLGERGLFRPERMEAAMQALIEMTERARELGVPPVQIKAVATSGARRALNAPVFFERIRERTGIKLQTISGEEEARLTWLGARYGLPSVGEDVAVFDLGGGSTEVVSGTFRMSLEIGAVRLTEAFLGMGKVEPQQLTACRAHVQQVLRTVHWPKLPRAVIAVGGTATTLTAMELGLLSFDASRIHGTRLDRKTLRRWVDRLLPATPEHRKVLCAVVPERADFLLAGALVLEACLECARRESLLVSTTGVRYGLIAER